MIPKVQSMYFGTLLTNYMYLSVCMLPYSTKNVNILRNYWTNFMQICHWKPFSPFKRPVTRNINAAIEALVPFNRVAWNFIHWGLWKSMKLLLSISSQV
jgi:hypothetical protein